MNSLASSLRSHFEHLVYTADDLKACRDIGHQALRCILWFCIDCFCRTWEPGNASLEYRLDPSFWCKAVQMLVSSSRSGTRRPLSAVDRLFVT